LSGSRRDDVKANQGQQQPGRTLPAHGRRHGRGWSG
jgi:hypothetical protein